VTQLKVPALSIMDIKLEEGFNSNVISWTQYVKSLSLVKNAHWVAGFPSYTLITFESEADKTLFVLKWGG
jgi:hypothetical protein